LTLWVCKIQISGTHRDRQRFPVTRVASSDKAQLRKTIAEKLAPRENAAA